MTVGTGGLLSFNTVDRWCQVVRGIKRDYSRPFVEVQVPLSFNTPLYPCLGELFSVKSLVDGRAKTIFQQSDLNCSLFRCLHASISPCAFT